MRSVVKKLSMYMDGVTMVLTLIPSLMIENEETFKLKLGFKFFSECD
jgi:hypothetical protein